MEIINPIKEYLRNIMNERMIKILFALFRSAISDEVLTEEEKSLYDVELLPILKEISKKHDILHLLAMALKKNSMIDLHKQEFEKDIFKAIYRYRHLEYELNRLSEGFEKAGIPYMPLKGTVINQFYPYPWMRTSCDIDVLVQEKDLNSAVKYLEECYGYKKSSLKRSHDISLLSENGNHIELHYQLIEKNKVNTSSSVLELVWKTAKQKENYQYWYEMSDEMFYFYHIAHMAKHFEIGGCGIRPFIDLWFLDKLENVDLKKREELLKQGGLLKFAKSVQKMSRIWFANEKMDFISQQMQNYILYGGVYGNDANRIVIQQQKQGGRFRYILSKIFLPYEILKFHYPILQKYTWLTPVMEVRRWGKLLFEGNAGRALEELKYNKNISKKRAKNAEKFLEEIGLKSIN